MIPNGAYTGEQFAVFAWDDGDRDPECIVASPSLGVIRDAYRQVLTPDPSFDHVELVVQTVTYGAWQPYAAAFAHREDGAHGA